MGWVERYWLVFYILIPRLGGRGGYTDWTGDVCVEAIGRMEGDGEKRRDNKNKRSE